MSFKSLIAGMSLSVICGAFSVNAAALSDKEQQQLELLKQTALTSELSYQLVESLTTEVGHRMMGSPGDKRAIAWAKQKMNALGFDKVWTEKVTAPHWQRGQATGKIIAPFPQDVVVLALGGSIGTPVDGIKAEVAHFNTYEDLKAAPAGSLEGKIAFVSYRMERHIDGSGYKPAVGTRVYGAAVAAEKGAVALIMRSVGTDDNRTAHTGIMRYKEGIKKIPAVALSNPDADMLMNQLSRGKPVKFQLNSSAYAKEGELITGANIIGEITGSEKPEELVVLGAHIDSWDVGTGALDDGLGIGMVLAAAHHIAKLEDGPKRTIRVVLFAGEEIGLVGAKQYVAKHKENIKNHVIGAEWDFGSGRIYKMKTGVGAQALNGVRELGQYLAPLGVAISKDNDAKAQSDMSLLSEEGMPSINFAPDGLAYFDYHHTENDTLDKVNADDLKQTTAVYTMFTYFASQSGIDFSQ